MSATILSRTTADAVNEDPYLMEPITYEEYQSGASAPSLSNQGGLRNMLHQAKKIKAELGIVDTGTTDDENE